MQVGSLVLSRWQANVRGVVIQVMDADSFRIKWFSTDGSPPPLYDTIECWKDVIVIPRNQQRNMEVLCK